MVTALDGVPCAVDWFGYAIEALDQDSDGRDDVVVGAPWWPAYAGNGAVYLLPGASVLP